MSAISKGIKKIGDWVGDNWQKIAMAALVVFSAGIATVGIGAYSSAVGAQGFWSATGSTMWAGATSVAGTFGVGGGASGSVAAGAGMEGATLLTGAGAQSLGVASQGAGLMGPQTAGGAMGAPASASGAVGTYTGPGSSFMGGGGSLFGGGADQAGQMAQAGAQGGAGAVQGGRGGYGLTQQQGALQAGQQGGGGMLGRGSLAGDMLRSAAPTLMYMAGSYLSARGEEEANKPKALWGVDMDTGEAMQPEGFAHSGQGQQQGRPGQRFTGPDGQEYEIGPDGQPRRVQRQGRVTAPPQAPWMRSQQMAPSVNNPIWQQNRGGV